MAPAQFVSSAANAESSALESGILTVTGWAASEGAGALQRLEVLAFGSPCAPVDEIHGLSSPDVGQAMPQLHEASNSRFKVRVALPPQWASRTRDVPISVRPIYGSGAGLPFRRLHHSSLPTPPDNFVALIGSDLHAVALEFFHHFVGEADLKRSDDVLDVGCGVGRMTYALAGYLDPSARYEGFDIIPSLVQWAQQNISPTLPNFRFSEAPIYNSYYNPAGHLTPAEFIFPHKGASFDFVFLTSVFTHMQGPEVRHYMREIRRVLRPGGRCLMTCYLLNEESRGLIQAGRSTHDISHPRGDSMIADVAAPELAVGFDEGLFRSWIEASRMGVAKSLYGNWCGRQAYTSYQDLLILQG